MKIRIIEPGMTNMTGDFGPVPFIDGISTRDVTSIEAARLAGLVAIETVEEAPRNPSAAQQVIDSRCIPMDEDMKTDRMKMIPDAKKVWTRGELEAIADKDGLNGLREIGQTLNVKANSIPKIIEAILKAQEPPVKIVEPVKSGSETVTAQGPANPAPAPAAAPNSDPAADDLDKLMRDLG